MESPQFEKEYRVHVYETGPDGKINLYSLFNYMQDIASDHAIRLGFGRDDLMKENRFWVLSRMYAVIADFPKWEDTIIVKTRTCGTDKLFAVRNFDICYPDRKHIASASSSWLILDQTTRKIQRPDTILPQYNSNLQKGNSSIRNAMKLEPGSDDVQLSSKFRIKTSDLDVNLHTNNVKYLKWVIDTYELDFIMNHFPCTAEINYLAESLYNEEIIIRTSTEKENNYVYSHSIIRTNDNKELCRIKLEWKDSSVKKVN
ncbi:MAG: thioesterase [Bacteroidales bacterium]|nr:thioesterase [Bacteroidales bacterium]